MFELIFKILGLICGVAFTIWFVAAMVNYTVDFIETIHCSFDRMGFGRKKDAE